jgi:hypothetical protein
MPIPGAESEGGDRCRGTVVSDADTPRREFRETSTFLGAAYHDQNLRRRK